MRPVLNRSANVLYYFVDDVILNGSSPAMRGNCSGLRGNCSALRGDCTGLCGDCSGLRGDLDDADLSEDERKTGVDLKQLVVTN